MIEMPVAADLDNPDLLPVPDLCAVLSVRDDQIIDLESPEVSVLNAMFEGHNWDQSQVLVEIRQKTQHGLAVGYAFMSGDVTAQLERLRMGSGRLSVLATPGITLGADRYNAMAAVVSERV